MKHDPYFLPLLQRALLSPQPKVALLDAFQQIVRVGEQPEHADEYRQFQEFMDEIAARYDDAHAQLEADVASCIRLLMNDLATDSFEGDEQDRAAALEVIGSVDAWRAEFESLCEQVRGDAEAGHVFLVLERDGHVVSPRGWDGAPLEGMVPGRYSLRTGTGMTLWQGELAAPQLLWALAHPGEPLKLAATTEGMPSPPTVTADFLEAEGRLLVYAGIESGTVQIELRSTR